VCLSEERERKRTWQIKTLTPNRKEEGARRKELRSRHRGVSLADFQKKGNRGKEIDFSAMKGLEGKE